MTSESGSATAARAGGIRIKLPARAENVALIRHAIAGVAESLGMSEDVLADLKTVVTEACMNVVAHAYGEEAGPLEVHAWPADDELVVVVRDYGSGIRPRPDADHTSLRLGMSLIAAMTSGYEIAGGSGRGTTITMRLSLSGTGPAAPGTHEARGDHYDAGGDTADDAILLTSWDGATLPAILARVISVLASRRDFTVDELADAVLFSDVISSDLSSLDGAHPVHLRLSDGFDHLSLRIGPLDAGMATELRQGLYLPEEIGGSLESLAEEVLVEEMDDGEYLSVRFGRARARNEG